MKNEHTVQAFNANSPDATVNVDYVNECPMCKNKIQPLYIYGALCKEDSDYIFNVVHFCPGCSSIFFVKYLMFPSSIGSRSMTLSNGSYSYVFPNIHSPRDFDDTIKSLSPDFIKIYNQSLHAESEGLDQISGIGYRKALEYLIKDYLILDNPEKRDTISLTNLGKCIQDFVTSPELKIVSQRATWLGNDHTHYVQKYTDKDIHDLKRMIDLTVHWILLIVGTQEAESIEKQ